MQAPLTKTSSLRMWRPYLQMMLVGAEKPAIAPFMKRQVVGLDIALHVRLYQELIDGIVGPLIVKCLISQ